MGVMLACRLLGHRYRFSAEGDVMSWECERGCGARGAKVYTSEAAAKSYAGAFDRDPRVELGRRGPFVALLPLRLWRWLRHRGRA